MPSNIIRDIEERSLNAWPAFQTLHLGGWVLRFADGYTRRANSVQPLYASSGDIEENITTCEQFYAQHDLPTIFKMTDAAQPADLDSLLESRGYTREAETSVQTLDLSQHAVSQSPNVIIDDHLRDIWARPFYELNGVAPFPITKMMKLLHRIVPQTGYIWLDHEGDTAALGLGVYERGYLGIFDIVTDANFRSQGFATQIVSSLLAWGMQQGAETAYLQVMKNNPAALHLYQKLGFREVYSYWYRVQPE